MTKSKQNCEIFWIKSNKITNINKNEFSEKKFLWLKSTFFRFSMDTPDIVHPLDGQWRKVSKERFAFHWSSKGRFATLSDMLFCSSTDICKNSPTKIFDKSVAKCVILSKFQFDYTSCHQKFIFLHCFTLFIESFKVLSSKSLQRKNINLFTSFTLSLDFFKWTIQQMSYSKIEK